jgi:hypothetical protein
MHWRFASVVLVYWFALLLPCQILLDGLQTTDFSCLAISMFWDCSIANGEVRIIADDGGINGFVTVIFNVWFLY